MLEAFIEARLHPEEGARVRSGRNRWLISGKKIGHRSSKEERGNETEK